MRRAVVAGAAAVPGLRAGRSAEAIFSGLEAFRLKKDDEMLESLCETFTTLAEVDSEDLESAPAGAFAGSSGGLEAAARSALVPAGLRRRSVPVLKLAVVAEEEDSKEEFTDPS